MLNDEGLRRAVEAAGLSAPVRWDDATTSTNDVATAMAADGTPAWTVVAAGHQTRGRGRQGRNWEDRPGRALLCSVVLPPSFDPGHLGLVSLAAGVAMAGEAVALSGLAVRCKWPNDLVVEGAKVGGILGSSEVVDGRVRHVVVGAGINLEAPDGVPGAGAIGDVDDEELLTGYLRRLHALVAGPSEAIVDGWRAASDTLGRRVEATTIGGDAVRGVAADLDDTGALLVDTDAGRVRVAFGDVRHLRAEPV